MSVAAEVIEEAEEVEDEADEVEDEASALGSVLNKLWFVCFNILMYLLCFDTLTLLSLLVLLDWCDCSAWKTIVRSFNLPETLH